MGVGIFRAAGMSKDVVFTLERKGAEAGSFTVRVQPEWAPLGAQRFLDLVSDGNFEKGAIYRVVEGFMAQFGIAADPEKYRKWSEMIKDDPVKQSNTRGKLSFAMRGPDTRSCQVFINYGNNANLDGQGFSPFAEVTSGMENVDAFTRQECDQSRMKTEGMAYLSDFPNLSYTKTMRIVS